MATEEFGIEVWRGGVNTWECDEMGHMNVRFYVARAMEGLIGLAAELAMPQAFSANAASTLMVREQHIRFLREARPLASLYMRAWVLELGESEARVLLVLHHAATGEPAASFNTLVSHVTPQDGRAFAWPRAVLERAARLIGPLPAYAAPRSVKIEPLQTTASLARADALDLVAISRGALLPQDCDLFGRMRLEGFIARVSDGVARVGAPAWGAVSEHAAVRPARLGGAVVEYRLAHLDWPRAGDRVVVRSGLSGVDDRTLRLVHWMLDPASGRPWGVGEAVAVTLDLDVRKTVPITAAAKAAVSELITPDLSL